MGTIIFHTSIIGTPWLTLCKGIERDMTKIRDEAHFLIRVFYTAIIKFKAEIKHILLITF